MEAEELIKKTREKADKMAHGNVFKTDFKVCELLTFALAVVTR